MPEYAEKKRDSELSKKQESSYILPYIDIYEDQEALYINADMPGVSKEKLSIELKDEVLTIEGKVTKSDLKPLIQEYNVGDYYRSFTLTEEIDRENISAKMENGVLMLKLPKVEKVKARKIDIKTA